MKTKTCALDISFSEFALQRASEQPFGQRDSAPLDEPMWLSWTLLSQQFKSEAFTAANTSAADVQDSLDFDFQFRGEGLETFVPTKVQESFPLKVFLCSHERVLAVALFDPFSALIKQQGGAALHFPVKHSERVFFAPIDDDCGFLDASMRISILLALAPDPPAASPSDEGPPSPVPAKPAPKPRPTPAPEPFEAILDPPKDTQGELQLRHYRVSIELRSISGLKRPGPLLFQFHYPYFGTRHPFRTKQAYYSAEVETRVANGAVSYQFSSTRPRLEQLLSSKPLVISAHQRSVMGTLEMGNVVINMSTVLAQTPHSYRCPVTKKTFKHLEDFNLHRQILQDLPSAPLVNEPITIYALDGLYSFFDVVEQEQALRGSTDRASQPMASTVSSLQQTKLRVVIILEDICAIGPEVAVPVSTGYKQHQGALYSLPAHPEDVFAQPSPSHAPEDSASPTFERMRSDWEQWRQEAEAAWRLQLQEKEKQLRAQIQREHVQMTENLVDDLRRAQQEVHRMEVKLKASLEEVERQRRQLTLQEEQMRLRVATKTQALTAVHHNVLQEKKLAIEQEQFKMKALTQQVEQLEGIKARWEQRALAAEKEVELLKQSIRQAPETALQQEVVRLQTLLAEAKVQVEKEKKAQAELKVDREHMRAQVYRLAGALKREREKMSFVARQELEQLRLEFLAREERFMLDGDRDALQTIRNDLSMLRGQPVSSSSFSQIPSAQSTLVASTQPTFGRVGASAEEGLPAWQVQAQRIQQEINRLKGTGFYSEQDPLIQELLTQLPPASSH